MTKEGDLISRQAVLASIKNLYPDMPVVDYLGARRKWLEKYTPYFDCENAVKQLPSVENKGEWLLYGYVSTKQIENCTERYCCSKCHNIISRDFRYFKFCPNCGADMRGE